MDPFQSLHRIRPSIPKTEIHTGGLPRSMQSGDLIIGDDSDDETLVISAPFCHEGDILILNRGILRIENTRFEIDGRIYIMGQGRLEAVSSEFHVIQRYMYEHHCYILEDGRLDWQDVSFTSSGQSWSLALTDQSGLSMKGSVIRDGYITTGLLHDSRAFIDSTENPGEFLCMGDNTLRFRHSRHILFWLVTPDQSQVDLSFPADTSIAHWSVSDSHSQVSGLGYEVSMDTCSRVLWGLISETGSEAVFRDTEFRVLGLLFRSRDSIAVHNLTNGSFHDDELLDLPDRSLRLINTRVQTWNLYGSSTVRLGVENCVFGELLAQDSSRVTLINSLCDGTGGYLGAMQNSHLIVINSLVRSQVIARDSAIVIGAQSAFHGTEIAGDERAILFLANTTTLVNPKALHQAVILEGLLPWVTEEAGGMLPIVGTARLFAGPANPAALHGYHVAWAPESGYPWKTTDGFHFKSVTHDTLAWWNTAGLPGGGYRLRMALYISPRDSISLESWARLYGNTDVPSKEDNPVIRLYPPFPNPVNEEGRIQFYLPVNSRVSLNLYDLRGRRVRTLLDAHLEAGFHERPLSGTSLPSGCYIVCLESGGTRLTRKLLLMK